MLASNGRILLFFVLVASISAHAQTNRCGSAVDTSPRFEQWLSASMTTAATFGEPVVYRIPVVVHIFHDGTPIGTESNFSKERIEGQIRSLNDDFRRRRGTPGFNDHPDGTDSHIEFVLAEQDPQGNPTDGIVRIDLSKSKPPQISGDPIASCGQYSYWDPDRYLNIWSMPLGIPPGIYLGLARFPVTNLEGLEGRVPADPPYDGVFVNAPNFGSGPDITDPNYGGGRTLTHEIGHFLGLLHTWGSINNSRQCDAYSDYCADTPPISNATDGCPASRLACDGTQAMTGNYMDGTYDACMNIFTKNQVSRMRTVLAHSPRRASLTTSTVIDRSDDVTGIEDPATLVSIYPNPATDALYVSGPADALIRGFTISGQSLFAYPGDAGSTREIRVNHLRGQTIVVIVEMPGKTERRLIAVR